jgi:acyl-CoA synthetase (AMP-forming)/AMP-acid ligase II
MRGGENIYPVEVERILLEAPGVKDIAMLGLPNPVWGETVAAIIVAEPGSADEAALIDFCKKRLARYRCPERVFFRDTLIYNVGGKVDRNHLRREI